MENKQSILENQLNLAELELLSEALLDYSYILSHKSKSLGPNIFICREAYNAHMQKISDFDQLISKLIEPSRIDILLKENPPYYCDFD
jgi:hypothetical protein